MYNQIFLGDCKDILSSFSEEFIDLTVTSPPYNIEVDYDKYKDDTSYEAYLSFAQEWLSLLYQKTNNSGRLCLNLPFDVNRTKEGVQSLYADYVKMAKEIGWKYKTTIVWQKTRFNHRTSWGSWLSASAPSIICPYEVIVVLYKNVWKKEKRGISVINKEDFMSWITGVWQFNGEKKKNHPAAFPEELPKRCISMFSYIDDVVCDPFSGIGTTCYVAKKMNRKYVGIELSDNYFNLSMERLKTI